MASHDAGTMPADGMRRSGRRSVALGFSVPSLPTSKLDLNPLDFWRAGRNSGPQDYPQKEKEQAKEGTPFLPGSFDNAALNAFHFASCEHD
jgi:hypothetical protein